MTSRDSQKLSYQWPVVTVIFTLHRHPNPPRTFLPLHPPSKSHTRNSQHLRDCNQSTEMKSHVWKSNLLNLLTLPIFQPQTQTPPAAAALSPDSSPGEKPEAESSQVASPEDPSGSLSRPLWLRLEWNHIPPDGVRAALKRESLARGLKADVLRYCSCLLRILGLELHGVKGKVPVSYT